jgi:hypothetical protein
MGGVATGIAFPESNLTLGAPTPEDAAAGTVYGLPVHRYRDLDGQTHCLSKWQLSPKELEEVQRTGVIWFNCWGRPTRRSGSAGQILSGVKMSHNKPIDRAVAALQAQFEITGLPKLHRDQFEAMALSVLHCWWHASPGMVEAAQKHFEPGHISHEYPDSDGVFVFGDIGTVWTAMITEANNEVVERRG